MEAMASVEPWESDRDNKPNEISIRPLSRTVPYDTSIDLLLQKFSNSDGLKVELTLIQICSLHSFIIMCT